MITTRRPALTIAAAILLMACTGCSDSGERSADTDAPDDITTAVPAAPVSLELTENDLDAYERGLRKEIEAVRAAQQASSTAKTAQERGDAIQASFQQATIPQGAEAAGLPVERYRELREIINEIFRTLDFQEKIDGPLSMDLSRADDATKERLARDPFDDLSSQSAAVLRARMDRLVPVWIEYVSLTAVAG